MTNKNQKNKGNNIPEKKKPNKILYAAIALVAIAIVVGLFISDTNILTGKKKASVRAAEIVEYENKADKYLKAVNVEMAKDVSPYHFILSAIEDVEEYSWKALDLDTTLTTSWVRLGYVNAQIHGKQALLRYESYMAKEMPEKVIEEEKNVIMYFSKANLYYDKALEFGTKDSAGVYYLKSEANMLQRLYDQAAINLTTAVYLRPDYRKYKAKLIEAYLNGGRFDRALVQINQYKQLFPDSDVPYLHLAGYYYNMGDTLTAIQNYETAIELGTKPDVGKFLHRYYTQHSNPEKADFYLQKAYEAQSTYDPERY